MDWNGSVRGLDKLTEQPGMATATVISGKKRAARKKRHSNKPAPPRAALQLAVAGRALSSLLLPDTAHGRWTMAAILAVAFGFRIARLLEMFPILVDESIYMHWAEIIEHQGQWFISLLDGKPPLQSWVLAVVRMIFGGDPLWEGRLVAVAVGLLSTIGIFAIGKRLGGETAGLIGAALYSVFPFAVLYDRLAYTEAFVNLNGITIVLTSLIAFAKPKKNWLPEIAAGVALGLGLFTKQTVLLFVYFPFVAGLWLGRGQGRGLFARWAAIYGIAAAFLVVTWVAIPEAPTLETHDSLLHHREFYVAPEVLLNNPAPSSAEEPWLASRLHASVSQLAGGAGSHGFPAVLGMA